jgi:hypothetical protein
LNFNEGQIERRYTGFFEGGWGKGKGGAIGRHLNISRRPLLICLHCCLHLYKALILLTPAKDLNKVFWGFLVVSLLFNHYQGYV